MDAPIGALGDGFEERLVLEERSDLARWGIAVLSLLMLPITLFAALTLSGLTLLALSYVVALSGTTCLAIFGPTLFASCLAFAAMLVHEFRTRNFRTVVLAGSALEVDQVFVDLADVKVWPNGLTFVSRSGRQWTVRSLREETRLTVMERLLPVLVAARREELTRDGEILVQREWWPLLIAVGRGLVFAVAGLIFGLLADPMIGVALGLGTFVVVVGSTARAFPGAGFVLNPTGLRRLGNSVQVPWSEVESCWSGSFFQTLLRVSTRRGDFSLVSSRNPVVWALLIQELKG